MEPKFYRYMDPRTKEDAYASPDDIDAVKRYLMAWKFFWEGPMRATLDDSGETIHVPVYEREDWIFSEGRSVWLRALGAEQRDTLQDSFPPEEVPVLEKNG